MSDESPENSCMEDEDLFYFESDYVALRGNPDYSTMLRTIAKLEAQRILAVKQLEELERLKKKYVEDPQYVLDLLELKQEIVPNNQMTVVKIPELETFKLEPKSETDEKEIDEKPSTSSEASKVRGRLVDDTKPAKFNQLWTYEEQERLEQLLVDYPEEEVESRRYAKIAKALGNRTALQVQSRVQKYFQKLREVGMPVPGRKPKYTRMGNLKFKHIQRASTFFPAFNVPVQMPDEDDIFSDGPLSIPAPPPPASTTDAVETPTPIINLTTSDEVTDAEKTRRTIDLLKAIRVEKEKTIEGYNPDPMAAKCEECLYADVSQTRWHCNTCFCFLNLCLNCFIDQLRTNRFKHITHDVGVEQDL